MTLPRAVYHFIDGRHILLEGDRLTLTRANGSMIELFAPDLSALTMFFAAPNVPSVIELLDAPEQEASYQAREASYGEEPTSRSVGGSCHQSHA